MSLYSRIKKLETAKSEAEEQPYLLAIHYPGETFTSCNGREIPLEEWEAMTGDRVILKINLGD